MTLHLCRETFTAELVEGRARQYVAGVDVLDDTKPEDRQVLAALGFYFDPQPATEEKPSGRKSAKS